MASIQLSAAEFYRSWNLTGRFLILIKNVVILYIVGKISNIFQMILVSFWSEFCAETDCWNKTGHKVLHSAHFQDSHLYSLILISYMNQISTCYILTERYQNLLSMILVSSQSEFCTVTDCWNITDGLWLQIAHFRRSEVYWIWGPEGNLSF